jgi:hypothetical protein
MECQEFSRDFKIQHFFNVLGLWDASKVRLIISFLMSLGNKTYQIASSCYIYVLTIGSKWTKTSEVFNQIDTGVSTWAIRSPRYIYGLSKKKWKKIGGRLYSVVSGKSGVWGIATIHRIYYRLGVTKRRPFGTRWKRVGGRLSMIDSGPKGIVCGVSRLGRIYCRL